MTAWLAVLLAVAVLGLSPALAREQLRRIPEQPVALGTLAGRYYRATQLQGHLVGQGLMEIPAYLTGGGLDFPYQRNPALREEIPFVDSFTITRFIGGYKAAWLKRAGLWDDRLGRQSMDYAVAGPDGAIRYRAENIREKLEPYLAAGYTFHDISISADNVPWALARDGGAEGPFGQNKPPADLAAWKRLVERFAADLKQLYGTGGPQFKIGNESDSPRIFDGTQQEFFDFYETAHRALHEAFPDSEIAPGEFTGSGDCSARKACTYDTSELIDDVNASGLRPSYIPRSLHGIQSARSTSAFAAVRRAAESYRNLGKVIPEVHQMGLLGQPFGSPEQFGSELGPRAAAWEFIVLMGLIETVQPRRVFHWDTFTKLAGTGFAILNGKGTLRIYLDRYRGDAMTRLPVIAPVSKSTDVVAVAFQKPGRTAVIVAASSLASEPTHVEAAVDVSSLGLPHGSAPVRAVRFTEDDNANLEMKQDLEAAGNLKAEFKACEYCTSGPQDMAADLAKARKMLLTRQNDYEEKVRQDLVFGDARQDGGIRPNAEAGLVNVRLEGNELLVMEY